MQEDPKIVRELRNDSDIQKKIYNTNQLDFDINLTNILLKNINQGVLVVCNDKIIFNNSEIIKITGFSSEELKSKSFFHLIYPDDKKCDDESTN